MAARHGSVLLICLFAAPAFAENAMQHLSRTAGVYSRLKSLQVEAISERRPAGGHESRKAVIKLYSSGDNRVRIETSDTNNVIVSVLLSDGKHVTEYRSFSKQYTRLPSPGMSVRFTPTRGTGWGEMSYETVAEGVTKASIRGRQELQVGNDRIRCVVIESNTVMNLPSMHSGLPKTAASCSVVS